MVISKLLLAQQLSVSAEQRPIFQAASENVNNGTTSTYNHTKFLDIPSDSHVHNNSSTDQKWPQGTVRAS